MAGRIFHDSIVRNLNLPMPILLSTSCQSCSYFACASQSIHAVSSTYAAPSGPPTDVQVYAVSSTALRITWSPPEPLDRNGVISGYELVLRSTEDGITRNYSVTSDTLSFQIEGVSS